MPFDEHGEKREIFRAERIYQTLIDISSAVNTTFDLRELFQTIHRALGRILDVTNFFIGIVDRQNSTIYFPFSKDEMDDRYDPIYQFKENNSLSGEIVQTRKPLLLRVADLEQRVKEERVVGTLPKIWLGVPLIIRNEVQGVMAVQSYTNPDQFDESDLEIMTSVSHQIALAIDRKRAADVLRANEERFRGFVEGTDELVVQMDREGIISYANHTAEKIFGTPADKCLGLSIFDFVHSGDIDVFLEHYMQLLSRQRTSLSLENRLVNPRNGCEIPLHWTINAQYDVQGQSIVVNGIARDLTDQRRTEEERLKIQKLESIGVLSGGIAHDFNNLLSVIMGNLDLAQAIGQVQDPGKTFLLEAKQACNRAKELTRRLITFSKGGAAVKLAGALDTLIVDCVRRAQEGFVGQIDLDLADDLWPVSFDAVQMGQAIDNLLANAIEAVAEDGQITVRAANCSHDTHWSPADRSWPILTRKSVELAILDTGRGIPAIHHSKIFDPYFSTKSRGTQKGMGLGLATTYAIIHRHHGEIRIWSEPDKGTAVHVYLPALEVEEAADLKIGMAFEPERPVKAIGNRIMVMDDEPLVISLASQMLERMGFVVTAVAEGEAAVESYRQALTTGKPYDTVILDLTIENGLGGIETLERLKILDGSVKAIVSSGYSDDPVVTDPVRYGFVEALPKPYALSDLADVLKKVLAGAAVLNSPFFASLQ